MAYSDKLVDHYKNPRNVGAMDKKSEKVGTGLVGAPACGDVMKLQIKVEDNIIEDAKFKTFGCGSAIASSSLATEWVKGKNLDEAMAIQNTEIVEELSLPPVKIHCSVLAEDAIKAAISDYKNRNINITVKRKEFKLPETAFVLCCFNNSYKISSREFDIWMRVLKKIDNSVLWLLKSNSWAEMNLKDEAKKRKIDENRLIFAEKVTPDVDMRWEYEDEEGVRRKFTVPMTVSFLWPSVKL